VYRNSVCAQMVQYARRAIVPGAQRLERSPYTPVRTCSLVYLYTYTSPILV